VTSCFPRPPAVDKAILRRKENNHDAIREAFFRDITITDTTISLNTETLVQESAKTYRADSPQGHWAIQSVIAKPDTPGPWVPSNFSPLTRTKIWTRNLAWTVIQFWLSTSNSPSLWHCKQVYHEK
jgi:hypothetical protein